MISYKRDVLERQSLSEVKMGRGSPICERVRKKIVEYFKNNIPQRQISSSTVHNIIKRFRETGEISVHKGQGRRPLLDARGLRALRWHCITHRHDSVIDITKWAQEYFQKPLSVNTIHRAICRCQLKLYHAKRKPYVNMVQKRRPDLSHIGNIWHIIKRKIRQRWPRTLQQLENYIRQEWDQILTPKLQKLITSMPRRLQTVLKRSGDATPW